MFVLVEDRAEIRAAQAELERALLRGLNEEARRDIGWRGNRKRDALLHSDGTYWYWRGNHRNTPIPRRLNWFGMMSEDRGVSISVEVNVPYSGNHPDVSGFFARRVEDNSVFLCHSGSLGGGKLGMKRDAFLAHSHLRPIPVYATGGKSREGLIVMPVKGPAAHAPAISFLERVIEFKQAVDAGETITRDAVEAQKALRAYYDESFGRRRGVHRGGIIDYVSRHGEVVKALHEWRARTRLPTGADLVKNVFLDLGVADGGRMLEAYEVKTAVARSSIYAGIGQLIVHGADDDCRKVLVLPNRPELENDIAEALRRADIEVIRYDAQATEIRII